MLKIFYFLRLTVVLLGSIIGAMKSKSGGDTAYRKVTITLDRDVLAAVDAAAAADHRKRSSMIAVFLRRVVLLGNTSEDKCKQQA